MDQSAVVRPERLEAMAREMAPYQADIVKTLTELVAYPSVKGPAEEGAPYGRANREVLDFLLKRGAEMGFKTGDVDHRCGYLEFGEGEKMVAAVCHLDVVPVGDGWTSPPFVLTERDGKLYGRGAADDKGPLVACLYALKALMDEGYEPPCRLRLIFGTDEECGSSCLRHYAKVAEIPVSGFTADADFPAIYAEKGHASAFFSRQKGDSKILSATGGAALNMVPEQAALTYLDADGQTTQIEARGRAAHASTPWNGQNAIAKLLAQVRNEIGLRDEPLLDLWQEVFGFDWDGQGAGLAYSDETGPLTMNLALLAADEHEQRLGFDIRYPVTQDREALRQRLAELGARHGFALTDYHDVEPLNLGKNSAPVRALMDVYNHHCGTEAEAVAIGGGTYARALPNILAYGMLFPGDVDCFHQKDEYVEKVKLFAATLIYKDALRALAEAERA